MHSSDIYPHLIHGFLDSNESAPKRHLDQFSRFFTAHPSAKHTDTQTQNTLRTTIGRIYAPRAGDAA